MPHGKQQAKTCTMLQVEIPKGVTQAKVLVPDKVRVLETKYKTWTSKK
jgi:hypothetical protein